MDLDQARQSKLSCHLSCVNLHTFNSKKQLSCHPFGVNLHTFNSEKQLSCHIFWCKLTHILTVKTAQLPPLWAFTLCFLVSSADNVCKKLGPRSGPTKRRACSGSNRFLTQMVFLKDFFQNKWFWKISRRQKGLQNYHPWGKELLTYTYSYRARENEVLIGYTCVKSPFMRACAAI